MVSQLLTLQGVNNPHPCNLLLPLTSSKELDQICVQREVLCHLPWQYKIRGTLPHLEGGFCSCLVVGASPGCITERGHGHTQRAPTACTSMCFTLPTQPCPHTRHSTGTARPPLPTGIPARWGSSLATAALGCFFSAPCSSSLFPPFHQFEAACSSPLLSLQHW